MTAPFDLALLGADDPLGEAVLALLDERELPIGHLHALTLREADSTVSLAGKDWPCENAAAFDVSRARALLVTSRSPAAARLAAEARTRWPEMPQAGLGDVRPAAALAVARVLGALKTQGELLAADAFVTLPTACAGKDGLDELLTQTRGLFNMETPETGVFPLQIAFNLVPGVAASGDTPYDVALGKAAQELLGGDDVVFSVTWAPMFYGAAAMLHARTREALDPEALRAALRARQGITLMETDLPAGDPTPATDAQGSQDVFVGRVRVARNHAKFWLVFDPIALEGAQMADFVENWIDKPATSMLT